MKKTKQKTLQQNNIDKKLSVFCSKFSLKDIENYFNVTPSTAQRIRIGDDYEHRINHLPIYFNKLGLTKENFFDIVGLNNKEEKEQEEVGNLAVKLIQKLMNYVRSK